LIYKIYLKTYGFVDGTGGGSGKDASHSSENDDKEEFVADDEFIIMSDSNRFDDRSIVYSS
jgi:hypothetical protein